MEKFFMAVLRNRAIVLFLAILLLAGGLYSLRLLPIDAVPDITTNQVQVLTATPALGAEETERLITYPVEMAMSGIPGIETVRSVSKYGLSAVTVVFQDSVPTYLARQLVMERLMEARENIPEGFGTPEIGPISTGLGEVYHFTLEGNGYSLMDLETLLDWEVAYRLRSVPGVVEVNSFGGEEKQYQVVVDPEKLLAFRLPLSRVTEALLLSNRNVGGGYFTTAGEQVIVQGVGLLRSLEDIGEITVARSEGGIPIRVRDIGQVRIGPRLRRGAASKDGEGETVVGIAMMLKGENSRVVVRRIKDRIPEIQSTLPAGVEIKPFYDRADLVSRTLKTVAKNLSEGAGLVVLVLFVFLGSVRGGLLVASVIPLSMAIAFAAMNRAGISGNLMSLGAIDFGLIVDGAVVIVENIVRRMGAAKDTLNDKARVIAQAAGEMGRPVLFGVLTITAVYIPILTLGGVEGKMFRPMAFTVVFALLGSLFLALTFVPALSSLVLKPSSHGDEVWVLRRIRPHYDRLLRGAIRRPRTTLGLTAALFLSSLAIFPRLGAVFVPELDEGAIAIGAFRLPSVSVDQAVRMVTEAEKVIKSFPEVTHVVSRTGSPEVATDPMGTEMSDIYVMLKPREEWTSAETRDELVERIEETLEETAPGMVYEFSQPIELRMNELIAGSRADVAIKIFGDDLLQLRETAERVAREVAGVRGAADVRVEQVAGLPFVSVIPDRERLSRYGTHPADILDLVEASAVGRAAGTIFEGRRQRELVVKLHDNWLKPEKFSEMMIVSAGGRPLPLRQVADVVQDTGPAQISHEDMKRRIGVEMNVRGRDLVGFVEEASARLERVALPPGVYFTFGGQFEQFKAARQRLLVAVPITLLLIFLLMFISLRDLKLTLLIALNLPLAATGGIYALWITTMPFSISAGVGFIALAGIAMMNGLVLASQVQSLSSAGIDPAEAVIQSCHVRLRPILMTALVASIGFLPMAISTGAGAEVQRPLATVVIGGILTSTLLTLVVLPALYAWSEGRRRGS